MAPFSLTLGLFCFWGMIGYAFLTVLRGPGGSMQGLLLAPAVGVSATVLPVFWLSRLGLPAVRFGIPLTAALAVAGLGLLIWRRPVWPIRRYLPFAGILLLAGLLTGRPMLEFGFGWLSYLNDDMANYTLGAVRLVNHGFFDVPSVDALVRGLDYSQYYWFMDVAAGVRPGSQLLLAWIAGTTRLPVPELFMPAILALHMGLVSAGGGLVYGSPRRQAAALATCALLAFSPLTSLGTLFQLIAQVAGMGLLLACAALIFPRDWPQGFGRATRLVALVGVVGAGLLIVYPEVVPILGVAWLVHLGLGAIRGRLGWRRALLAAVAAGVVCLALVGSYLLDAWAFLAHQITHGTTSQERLIDLFPHYLMPNGLAKLWGIVPIWKIWGEPWLSISILVGGGLLIAAAVAASRQAWRGEPCATLGIVMLALMGQLFAERSAFGLFKLAMFIQPPLLGVIALWSVSRPGPAWRRHGPWMLVALLGLYGQTLYVQGSRGARSVPAIRNDGLQAEIRRLPAMSDTGRIELDTTSPALAKLQAAYLVGRAAVFRNFDAFGRIAQLADTSPQARLKPPWQRFDAEREVIHRALGQTWATARFRIMDSEARDNLFTVRTDGITGSCEVLVFTTGRQGILNRRRLPGRGESLAGAPCRELRNHLLFVPSGLGGNYFSRDREKVGLYRLEADPIFRAGTMAGMGRYLVLEVVNPEGPVRVGLAMTATFRGDGGNLLPRVAVDGEERRYLPVAGRGSARLFSPPLRPQVIRGRHYLGIDMGVNGRQFPYPRTGLMRLYGQDVPVDERRIVVFGRDVSLVSEAEYRVLRPPSTLARFPDDLAHPDLEFSGLYEDGWASEEFSVGLLEPSGPVTLRIAGTVPRLNDPGFTAECAVAVDGREMARPVLRVGDFSVRVPVVGHGQRAQIHLRCANVQRFPAPNNRPVLARLGFIGFEGAGR